MIEVQPLIGSTNSAFSIVYKLCSVGNGAPVLSILTHFLSNQPQHILVEGCRSKLVNVVLGVPQENVLSPLLLLLYTLEHFLIQENKLIGNAMTTL